MNIPITPVMWGVAFLPIVVLLILMIRFGWSARQAAAVGLVIAASTGIVLYKANFMLLVLESFKGVWSALPILLVIWTAVLVYQASNEAGAFQVIRVGMRRLLPNELLLVLAMGWIFESFLQGITGFGVPVAVGAPLLIGIGVSPLWAVIIPLLGQSWGNTFGTLAAAWDALAMSAGLETGSAEYLKTAFWTAFFILLWNAVLGFMICWFYGRGKALKKGWPVVLCMTLIQGGGELFMSQINTTLACFLPACVSLIAILLLGRTRVYGEAWRIEESRIMDRSRMEAGVDHAWKENRVDRAPEEAGGDHARKESGGGRAPEEAGGDHARKESCNAGSMNLVQAFVPYLLLTAITLTVLLVKPVNAFLGQVSVGFAFPETRTGYDYVNAASECFSPLKPFTHASMFLLLSFFASLVYYRKRGWIQEGGAKRVLSRTVSMATPSSLAVTGLVVMSRMMSSTGQTIVLANGIAAVLGKTYVILAPLIGLLGTFMTGSNMSSNILFGDFQMTTAKLLDVNAALVLGAQSSGGSVGSTLSPSNIVLGTTTAEIPGNEGKVMEKLIRISLPMAVVIGLLAYGLQ